MPRRATHCFSSAYATACLLGASLALSLPHAGRAQEAADSIRGRHLAGTVHLIEGAVDLIGVSVGPDGVLLVDAGYMETEPGVRDALEDIGPGSPQILINTHWHHAFANEAFAEEALVLGHASLPNRMSRANYMYDREVPPWPAEALPDITFSDSLTLRFNGETIRIKHYPHAHTDGDIVVFFEESNVVFTGDLFVPQMPWIDVGSGGNVYALVEAIDRVLAWIPENALIVPGHDHPVGIAELRAYREMLGETLASVEAAVAEEKSLAEIQAAGVPERWRSWEKIIPATRFLESVHAGVVERHRADPRAAESMPGREERTVYEFLNGLWYADGDFEPGTWYSVDGVLTRARPTRIDSLIDLAGAHVVPPYGEAHAHDLNDPATLDTDIRRYLDLGIFYVMEQDPIVEIGSEILSRVNQPTSVDVAYTQGVVTPSWGMIADFYAMMADQGRFGPGATLATLDTKNLFLIDNADDLEQKWPLLAARNRNFLKVILMFSEELERRRRDSAKYRMTPPNSSQAGLDPALLPSLVARAHAAGLRVSVHIETAEDFRLAVAAGADVIAHWPAAWQIGTVTGFPAGELAPWLLTDSDARAAAEAGAIAISTILRQPDRLLQADFEAIHRKNLALFRDHGVRIAVGSDGAEGGAVAEARYLAELGGLDNRWVLDLLAVETPRAIFPGRRIGALTVGFEASFLVLEGNPLADLDNLDRVRMRVKQGMILPGLTGRK